MDVSGQVVRIEADWSAVRDTLALGGSPARAWMTGADGTVAAGTAYLTSYFGGILAYDTATFPVIHGMGDPVDDALGYMGLAIHGDRLFAANFETDTVTEFDLTTLQEGGSFIAGDGPSVLAVYDPDTP